MLKPTEYVARERARQGMVECDLETGRARRGERGSFPRFPPTTAPVPAKIECCAIRLLRHDLPESTHCHRPADFDISRWH